MVAPKKMTKVDKVLLLPLHKVLAAFSVHPKPK